jgi:hypothetical protein
MKKRKERFRNRLKLALIGLLIIVAGIFTYALDHCQPEQAKPYILDERTGGWSVKANYDEVIQLNEEGEPCRPWEWLNVVDFELRTIQGAWVADQVITGTCQVFCGSAEVICDDLVTPQEWDVPDGRYHVWYRWKWVNTIDGRIIISHTQEQQAREDDRRFVYLETVSIFSNKVYCPLIERGHR